MNYSMDLSSKERRTGEEAVEFLKGIGMSLFRPLCNTCRLILRDLNFTTASGGENFIGMRLEWYS